MTGADIFGESDGAVVLDYLCRHCQFAQEVKRVDSVADVPSAPRVYDSGGDCSEAENGHQMRLVSARRQSPIAKVPVQVPLGEILDAVDESTCDYWDNQK